MDSRQTAQLDYDQLAREALDGGFTIGLDGVRPTTGFATAWPGRERRITLSERPYRFRDLADAIYAYVVDHGHDLRLLYGAHLGAWRDGNTIVLDVTQVLERESVAVTLGRLRGQDAIYNLATGETITLRQGVVAPRKRSAAVEADERADLARELANDEARIAAEMERDELRGIAAPDY